MIAPIGPVRIMVIVRHTLICTFWYMETLVYIIRGCGVRETCQECVRMRGQERHKSDPRGPAGAIASFRR